MQATLKTDQQQIREREEIKLQVWNKAEKIPGFNEKLWRRDVDGMILQYTEYCNPLSVYGWYVGNRHRVEKNDEQEPNNLQALNLKTTAEVVNADGHFN